MVAKYLLLTGPPHRIFSSMVLGADVCTKGIPILLQVLRQGGLDALINTFAPPLDPISLRVQTTLVLRSCTRFSSDFVVPSEKSVA
jgi:hypothetical protein